MLILLIRFVLSFVFRLLFCHFVSRGRWWWNSPSSSFWLHSCFLNLFLRFWFRLFFYWLLDLLLFGRRKWSFLCFGWRRLNFHLFFSLMGIKSEIIFFCWCFFFLLFLMFRNFFLWWRWRWSFFNFILSDRNFLFNWRFRLSYYICFLRWRWWRRNFRLFLWFELCFLDWLWPILLFLRIVPHWLHVCGIVFLFLLFCIFLFLLLLHKGQSNWSLIIFL